MVPQSSRSRFDPENKSDQAGRTDLLLSISSLAVLAGPTRGGQTSDLLERQANTAREEIEDLLAGSNLLLLARANICSSASVDPPLAELAEQQSSSVRYRPAFPIAIGANCSAQLRSTANL